MLCALGCPYLPPSKSRHAVTEEPAGPHGRPRSAGECVDTEGRWSGAGPGLLVLGISGPRTNRLLAQRQLTPPPPPHRVPGWRWGGKIQDEDSGQQVLDFKAGTSSLATWFPARSLVSTRQIQGNRAGRQGSGHAAVPAKLSALGEAAPVTHMRLALPGPPSHPPHCLHLVNSWRHSHPELTSAIIPSLRPLPVPPCRSFLPQLGIQ